MQGNPICSHPHFRVMCLMVIGLQIKRINGETVIKSEKQFAKLMSKKSVEAVQHGWLMDMKHHSDKEFNLIIKALLENRKSADESKLLEKMATSSANSTLNTSSLSGIVRTI